MYQPVSGFRLALLRLKVGVVFAVVVAALTWGLLVSDAPAGNVISPPRVALIMVVLVSSCWLGILYLRKAKRLWYVSNRLRQQVRPAATKFRQHKRASWKLVTAVSAAVAGVILFLVLAAVGWGGLSHKHS